MITNFCDCHWQREEECWQGWRTNVGIWWTLFTVIFLCQRYNWCTVYANLKRISMHNHAWFEISGINKLHNKTIVNKWPDCVVANERKFPKKWKCTNSRSMAIKINFLHYLYHTRKKIGDFQRESRKSRKSRRNGI